MSSLIKKDHDEPFFGYTMVYKQKSHGVEPFDLPMA
jgi:hypothetical protein